MDFTGKRILVVGMGKSGVAAAHALLSQKARVVICDRNDLAGENSEVQRLRAEGAEILCGRYPDADFDLVVVSPGVPLDEAPLARARDNGVPVWGELELAFRLKSRDVEIAAITGTNGKTTTTALFGEILKTSRIPSATAGNIGVPLVSVIEKMESGWISCEVSSFQLETIHEFRPRVATIINITPDHLDRHHTLEEYVAAKARIFENQTLDDCLILNWDDQVVKALAAKATSQVVFFSKTEKIAGGIYVRDNTIYSEFKKAGAMLPVSELRLRGSHNLENVLAAIGLALAAGVSKDFISETLRTFTGVRHRLEEVGIKNGVLYVNDSKGTNPDSTIKALRSFSEPIVLVAGGRHKGGDLNELAEVIKDRVRVLVLLGEAKNIIKEKMMSVGYTSIVEARDLEEAVKEAAEIAQPGEVVLLSPACASWDMFNNYEERGDLFCALVRSLPG